MVSTDPRRPSSSNHRLLQQNRHVGDFELAVLRREVEVGLAGHHIGFRLDGSQCLLEIAVIKLVVADIAVLPGPLSGWADVTRRLSPRTTDLCPFLWAFRD